MLLERSMYNGFLLGSGWIEADPTLVAIVIAAVVAAAVIYVARGVRRRRTGGG